MLNLDEKINIVSTKEYSSAMTAIQYQNIVKITLNSRVKSVFSFKTVTQKYKTYTSITMLPYSGASYCCKTPDQHCLLLASEKQLNNPIFVAPMGFFDKILNLNY